MGLSFVGSATTATEASATSITGTRPGGGSLAVDDAIVAFHTDQSSASSAHAGNAAFTRVGPAFVASNTDGRVTGIFIHRVTNPGTEPGTYTFERNGAATRSNLTMVAVRGTDWSQPVDVAVTSYAGTSITNGRRTATLTAVQGGLQFFLARCEFTAGNSSTPTSTPSGFTTLASFQTGSGTTGSRSRQHVAYRTVGPGATGTSDIVWSGLSPSNPSAQSVVFRAAPPTEVTASGAFSFTGSATVEAPDDAEDPTEVTASGGFEFGGTASVVRHPVVQASGGFTFGGAATVHRAPIVTAGGGFTFEGSATVARTPKVTAGGGFAYTGSATVARTPQVAASGGYLFTGGATTQRTPVLEAVGSFEFTGSAWVGPPPPPWSGAKFVGPTRHPMTTTGPARHPMTVLEAP